jgi:hypothetical protein
MKRLCVGRLIGKEIEHNGKTTIDLDSEDEDVHDTSSAIAPMGDGTFVIEFGYICYQDTYPMYRAVSCMYFECILMCPVHIHQDTSRYIKIHQDTSRYIKIHLYLSLWLS